MHRLPAGNHFASASSLGASCKFLQLGRTEARRTGAALVLSIDQMNMIFQSATLLKKTAAQVDMVACVAASTDLERVFKRLPRPTTLGLSLAVGHIDDLVGNLEYLLRTFRDEIDARLMFVLPPVSVSLYDQVEPLFGEAVESAFRRAPTIFARPDAVWRSGAGPPASCI